MKNRRYSKIITMILTMAMVLSMGAVSFAADTGVDTSGSSTITIKKEIIVYNDENTTVYGPGIEYEYAITNGTAGKTVTDKDGDTMAVKAGVTDGLTLTDSKATFTKNAEVSATSAGTAISDTVTASVDLTKFSAAGIYRYVLTETKPSDFETVGLTRPEGYVTTRNIDVYIKNGDNGLELAGTVVFLGEGNISGKASVKDNEITGKTEGFTEAYDKDIDDTAGSDGTGMADKYYTYNYTLTKSITGTMADKTHAFPFVIATAGAVTGQQFTVDSAVAAIGTDISKSLADGGTVEIKGLPANATVNVTETNDTADTYTVSATDATAGELIAAVSTESGKTQTTDAQAVSNYASNKTTKPDATLTATTFTNNLDEVSPTNVVLRYAPYLFMLAAAVALFMISRRRKSEEE